MPTVPTLNNSIGYNSLIYQALPRIPGSILRNVLVGVTGAYYSPTLGGATSLINTSGVSGGYLFVRDINSYNNGATGPNRLITTNSLGNGSITIPINNGKISDYVLLYAPNQFSYDQNDPTNPVYLTLQPPLSAAAGGILTINKQTIIPTGPTAATLQLSGIVYDGFTASDGLTGGIVVYQQRVPQAVTGTTGGTIGSIISGGTAGIITGFVNGTVNGTINYNLNWDSNLDDLYMIYYMGLSGLSGASYNYVSVNPINLPLRNSPTVYNSSVEGTTAKIYNINYNYTGITGAPGSTAYIYVTNAQGNTSVKVPILKEPSTGLYMSQYFFGPTGGTSIVLPGSYYRYVKPNQPNLILSGSTASLTSHSVSSEGVSGTLIKDLGSTNNKTVLTLTDFNYFDIDGNSIFNTIGVTGSTGKIYVVLSNYGTTGTLYTGPTGIPFSGTTASITYNNSGPYRIEFPGPVPYPSTTQTFKLSYYDNKLGTFRNGTKNFPIQIGKVPYPEVLQANILQSSLTTTRLYVKFNNFDYFDQFQNTIFSTGLTGSILLIDGRSDNTIASTPYIQGAGNTGSNPNREYILSTTGIFETGLSNVYYIKFIDSNGVTARPALKSVPTYTASENLNYTITNYTASSNSLRFTITNFDYLEAFNKSIFYDPTYSPGSTGFIQLYNTNGTLLQSIPNVINISNSYNFSINVAGPYTDYYIKFFDSNLNSTRQAMKIVSPIGLSEVTSTYSDTGSAYGFTGPANLQFPYLFSAAAAEVTEITVLGELTAPLAFDQKIVLNVPASELQRMLVYDSAWSGGQYGTGASGGGGFTGLSGTTAQNSSGFTGPNVGLFLKYVLSQVNVQIPGGFTGHNGVYGQSDRLGGLDLLYSGVTLNNYQTIGNSGGVGNPWGLTNGSTGFFSDDSGTSGPQILQFMKDNNITGVGATYSSQSLLNFIPAEAIRSIKQQGFSIDKISNVVNDVDTTMDLFVPSLRNLFEQSVGYGRVDDTISVSLSNVPSSLSGVTGDPWSTASHIYGVDFVNGDSLTFYVRYAVGAVRRYGIDPSVVAGLGSGWQNLPALTLTFNGKTFDIPIGASDPASGLTGGGGVGGSDADTELANGSMMHTIAVQLIASPGPSNFDY